MRTFAPMRDQSPNRTSDLVRSSTTLSRPPNRTITAATAPSVVPFDFGRIAVQSPTEATPDKPSVGDRPGRRLPSPHMHFEPPLGHDFSRVPIPANREKAAEYGAGGSGGPLPYITEIQRSFGRHDVSHVVAYQGVRAAAASRVIGARAYTVGDRVAFAGVPDLRTAAHEATHAVQQRAGVSLSGYVGEAGDPYERHADAVADQVVRGRPAEALLDRMAPPGSPSLGVRQRVLQRLPKPIATNFGNFDETKYETVGPAGSENGVFINLMFDPFPDKVDASKIGLTQAARTQLGGVAVSTDPTRSNRRVPSGTGEGYEIDRATSQAFSNPIYASKVPSPKDKLGDTPFDEKGGQWGFHFKDASGVHHQVAKLNDRAHQPDRGNKSGQTFETTAVAVEGKQSGTYMGSVTWGWSVDGSGSSASCP